jgi:hypothetical protein
MISISVYVYLYLMDLNIYFCTEIVVNTVSVSKPVMKGYTCTCDG